MEDGGANDGGGADEGVEEGDVDEHVHGDEEHEHGDVEREAVRGAIVVLGGAKAPVPEGRGQAWA